MAQTQIGSVRGEEGYYHYRERSAPDLVRQFSLEQIWQFILSGSMVDSKEEPFAAKVASLRHVDQELLWALEPVAKSGCSYHLALMAAIPLMCGNLKSGLDSSSEELHRQILHVVAAMPTLLAAIYRLRQGLEPIAASSSCSHAADWLRMVGVCKVSKEVERAMEVYLSATIDHGFNASTFATRVVASTGADTASALCAGLGALSGPLHGGAPSRVLEMLDKIGDPKNTEVWIRNELDAGRRIMGFGHAVYRGQDPRSKLLQEAAAGLGSELFNRAVEIEKRILSVLNEWKPKAGIVTNVEYYAGVVLHQVGLPAELFTPSFMISRAIGWGAHILEQSSEKQIIRPSALYIGPKPQQARL